MKKLSKLSNDNDSHQQEDHKLIPTEQSPQLNSPSFSSVIGPWKDTRTGGEWARYDEVVITDSRLREKLKPIDNFKIVIEDYKYSVKKNSNGSIVVFRNKKYPNTLGLYNKRAINNSNHTILQNEKDPDTQSRHIDNPNLLDRSFSMENNNPILEQNPCCGLGTKTFTDIKLVNPEQFQLEDDWEIHPIMPICTLREKPYVILVRAKTQNE